MHKVSRQLSVEMFLHGPFLQVIHSIRMRIRVRYRICSSDIESAIFIVLKKLPSVIRLTVAWASKITDESERQMNRNW